MLLRKSSYKLQKLKISQFCLVNSLHWWNRVEFIIQSVLNNVSVLDSNVSLVNIIDPSQSVLHPVHIVSFL